MKVKRKTETAEEVRADFSAEEVGRILTEEARRRLVAAGDGDAAGFPVVRVGHFVDFEDDDPDRPKYCGTEVRFGRVESRDEDERELPPT